MSRHTIDRAKLAAAIIKGASPYVCQSHSMGFKTGCTSAVLGFFGITKNSFKFCQTTSDMGRLFNLNGFSMVNVGKRRLTKNVIGKAVKNLNKYIKDAGFYLVSNTDHVFLAYVSDSGEVSYPIDTAPTYNRRIESIHRIKNKSK